MLPDSQTCSAGRAGDRQAARWAHGPSAVPHVRGLCRRHGGNSPGTIHGLASTPSLGWPRLPPDGSTAEPGVAVPRSHPLAPRGCRCRDPPPAEPGAAGSRPALPWLHLGLRLIDNFPGAVTCQLLCMTRAGIHWSEIAWNKLLELVKRLRRPPHLRCCGGAQALPVPLCHAGQGGISVPGAHWLPKFSPLGYSPRRG